VPFGDKTGSVLTQAKNRQAPPTLRRRPLIGQVIKRRRLIGPLKGPIERIAPIMRRAQQVGEGAANVSTVGSAK
jgi:hypothetical protein